MSKMAQLAVRYKKRIIELEGMIPVAFKEGYDSHISPMSEAWENSEVKKNLDNKEETP